MSPIVAKLVTKYDPRALASFGLILMGVVTLMRSFWITDADFMTLALPQIIQGFAVPFFFIPLTNIALGAVRPDELASAAGFNELCSYYGRRDRGIHCCYDLG